LDLTDAGFGGGHARITIQVVRVPTGVMRLMEKMRASWQGFGMDIHIEQDILT